MDKEVIVKIKWSRHITLALTVSPHTTIGYLTGYAYTTLLHRGVYLDPDRSFFLMTGNIFYDSNVRLGDIGAVAPVVFRVCDDRDLGQVEFFLKREMLDPA